VVESDPLQFVGFRPFSIRGRISTWFLLHWPDVGTQQNIDLMFLGAGSNQNLFDVMASLKMSCPHLRIIVTGSGTDEVTILEAIASGAKGYVDAAASPADFVTFEVRTVKAHVAKLLRKIGVQNRIALNEHALEISDGSWFSRTGISQFQRSAFGNMDESPYEEYILTGKRRQYLCCSSPRTRTVTVRVQNNFYPVLSSQLCEQ